MELSRIFDRVKLAYFTSLLGLLIVVYNEALAEGKEVYYKNYISVMKKTGKDDGRAVYFCMNVFLNRYCFAQNLFCYGRSRPNLFYVGAFNKTETKWPKLQCVLNPDQPEKKYEKHNYIDYCGTVALHPSAIGYVSGQTGLPVWLIVLLSLLGIIIVAAAIILFFVFRRRGAVENQPTQMSQSRVGSTPARFQGSLLSSGASKMPSTRSALPTVSSRAVKRLSIMPGQNRSRSDSGSRKRKPGSMRDSENSRGSTTKNRPALTQSLRNLGALAVLVLILSLCSNRYGGYTKDTDVIKEESHACFEPPNVPMTVCICKNYPLADGYGYIPRGCERYKPIIFPRDFACGLVEEGQTLNYTSALSQMGPKFNEIYNPMKDKPAEPMADPVEIIVDKSKKSSV